MARIVIVALCLLVSLLPASLAWALSPFMVFFDRDSVALTPQGHAILDNAAAASRNAEPHRLVVQGHTDRRGPSGYNLALSRRRADAVRAALIMRGVPEAVISIEAHGEDQTLVETADGVGEPQNRRVALVFMPLCGPWSPSPSPAC